MDVNNNQNPIISVCIPCYNVSKFLDKLFVCLNNQTFKFIKLVFIDDGSTDDTYDKILEYKKICKYETIVHKQKNSGIAIVRNRLLDLANTEYVFFIDPDDEIPFNALEILYKATENGKYDIVSGRSRVVFNDKMAFPFIASYRYKKNITSGHYVKSNLCTVWASLFRRSIFDNDRFLENYIFEDLGILSYIFLKNENFKQIKNIVYYYNRRKKIISLSTFSKINRWKFIDLYHQTVYSFNHYKKENWLDDKKYKRLINGSLFQIIISTLWLSKYFSNNKKISCLPIWQILENLKEYNMKLRFSKTFWKSLSFFYLKWNNKYSKIDNFVNKDNYNNKKIVLTSDDFFEDIPGKLEKNKIYFLKPQYGEKMVDIVKSNPQSTFLVDQKYHNEFSYDYLNVSFGVEWAKFNIRNDKLQYIDARKLLLVDRETLNKLLLLPKYMIVFLDKSNKSIPGITKYLNLVFL